MMHRAGLLEFFGNAAGADAALLVAGDGELDVRRIRQLVLIHDFNKSLQLYPLSEPWIARLLLGNAGYAAQIIVVTGIYERFVWKGVKLFVDAPVERGRVARLKVGAPAGIGQLFCAP